MHCVDCHFAQDSHGNGHIYTEVANAVEIDCVDCHGTANEYPTLKTSGPAAPPGGTDLSLIRNPDGRARFEWRDGKLYQRSLLWPDREWEMSLTKDSVDPTSDGYNMKSAQAKTMRRGDTVGQSGDPTYRQRSGLTVMTRWSATPVTSPGRPVVRVVTCPSRQTGSLSANTMRRRNTKLRNL